MKKSKKVLKSTIALGLSLFCVSQPVLAVENKSINNTQDYIVANMDNKYVYCIQYDIEVQDARNLAIWFIANNIKDSLECGWNQDTRISKEELVLDENNNTVSYIFKLEKI